MHHTLVSYIVYLYEWMGAEIDTFTHPNFSKFGDQAAALAHALSAEVTPRRLLRWNALSEGPGCPTVSENSSSNPSFKPGSMLVRSKPVIIFMYIYVCVWNICFMNYKYHLRFLGSTSSDRQDTQVPLVACFTITYRIQQQMDHRATPAAPDLRKAWAKKGTRHRSTKTMRGWGWNSVILYESTMSMGFTGFILRHLLEMWDAHLWWSVLLCVSQHLQKSITNLWVNYPNSIHRTLGRFFWKASSGVVATSQSWTAPDNQILGDLCCCNTLRMMLVAWLPCHSNRLKPNKPQIS